MGSSTPVMARACSEHRKAMALAMSAGSGRRSQRVHAHDLVHVALAGLHLGAQRRRHHVGRPHAVDANAVAAEFDRQQLRQPLDRHLAHVVGRNRQRHAAVDRAQRDDGAALCGIICRANARQQCTVPL